MIPLSLKSHYSLMWGTAAPAMLCRAAATLGYTRIALTDTNNLYGLWPFLKACGDTGITPIIGAEITGRSGHGRAVCLVKNIAGYRNLCRLITCRHQDADFDLSTALPAFGQGLLVLSRDPACLITWREAGVTVAAALPRKPDSSNFRLRQFAVRNSIPAVAVPGAAFLSANDFHVHRLLRAINRNTVLARLNNLNTAPPDAWLAGPAEYAARFAIWPETIAATEALAAELTFTGPQFGLVMPPWQDQHNREARPALRHAAYKGACRRYGRDLPETVVDRLEHELAVIHRMHFSGYFLVVADIVRQSPRICGRGSGAASLVAYCLGITNVCPIKHNLYFERFLNPGRQDPPDIDVDFAWDERDDVIAGVLRRHAGHAAMVCNHVACQPRMAIRETAKVHGLTDAEIGRVTKRLPWFWRIRHIEDDLLEQLRNLPEIGSRDFPPPWPEVMRLARRIIGAPRHLSVHSGGVIITPEPIDTYVPVECAPKGVPIVQWEKDGVEESGLVKIDLLGNRSLAVIRDAVANVRGNDIAFDETTWEPEDDPATQHKVARGDTMGCFYIESPATRQLQKKAKVGDFEHIVIHSSIIRPAANAFIRAYVRRLHGAPWDPIHPLLADVLHETYGIMVYQEDVSKTAVALAGFSHADADGLRKVMSKKDKARQLTDYRRRFFEGAGRRGVSEKQTAAIWDMIMSFSGYSFCKPHSASYARVSFQAAYLKTHFPAEFMAAVISNQGGYYSTAAYVSEARRSGLHILPPDVNQSDIRWRGTGRIIRVGLQSVRNLSTDTQQRILARRQNALFRDAGDFMNRVQPEAPEAVQLIHAGALDSLHPGESRAALLWEAARHRNSRTRRPTAVDLFEKGADIPRPCFPPETEPQRLRTAYAAMGFLCDRHPMAVFPQCEKLKNRIKIKDMKHYVGQTVRIAGLLITGKTVYTKHAETMEFITFEDETGLAETTFFPAVYRRFCAMLDRERPFILTGKVESDFDALSLTVSRVETCPTRNHG